MAHPQALNTFPILRSGGRGRVAKGVKDDVFVDGVYVVYKLWGYMSVYGV